MISFSLAYLYFRFYAALVSFEVCFSGIILPSSSDNKLIFLLEDDGMGMAEFW